VQVSVSQFDFGPVEKGSMAPSKKTFTVTTAQGATAQIAASDPWLVAMPSTVRSGGLVEVSIETGKLPLGQASQTPPDIGRLTLDQLKRLPGQAWWLIGLGLLVGFGIRAIWQGAAILLIGWLGVLLVAWSSRKLLPRLVVSASGQAGRLTVSAGAASQTITVRVKAMPSLWRVLVGWVVLASVVLGEAGVVLLAGWYLFQILGGLR
jgi:hypothetical protein